MFRKACDEGDNAEACHRYSALFINGIENVCEKNMSVAFKYSLKVSLEQSVLVWQRIVIHIQACELGNLGGCVNVSRMYSKGEGTDKNPVAAKE